MSKSSSTRSILARRWIWLTVAVLAIFLVGVSVGAGAEFTDAEDMCRTAANAAASAIALVA